MNQTGFIQSFVYLSEKGKIMRNGNKLDQAVFIV